MGKTGGILLRWLTVFILAGIGSFALSAQNKAVKTVQGTVLDTSGEPLPGATVYTPDKKFGVVADEDGHFTLTGVPVDAVLTVEFMGYKPARINVADYKVTIAQ